MLTTVNDKKNLPHSPQKKDLKNKPCQQENKQDPSLPFVPQGNGQLNGTTYTLNGTNRAVAAASLFFEND